LEKTFIKQKTLFTKYEIAIQVASKLIIENPEKSYKLTKSSQGIKEVTHKKKSCNKRKANVLQN
jgi:hypothetical protein